MKPSGQAEGRPDQVTTHSPRRRLSVGIVGSLFRRMWDLLFGFDYFIATVGLMPTVSRKTCATNCRKETSIAFSMKGTTETGGNLHLMQRLALGRTTRPIVVVSPLAHAGTPGSTQWLLEEVREFKRVRSLFGRSAVIAPIGTKSGLSGAVHPNFQLLHELPLPADNNLYIEDEASEQNGYPHPNTIAKLETDFAELRRRRFRLRVLTVAALLMTLLAAAVWQAVEARSQGQRRQALLGEASQREYLNGVSLMRSQQLREATVNLGQALRYNRENRGCDIAQSHCCAEAEPRAARGAGPARENATGESFAGRQPHSSLFEDDTVVGLTEQNHELVESFRFVKTYLPFVTKWSPDSKLFAQSAGTGLEIRAAASELVSR